MAESGMAGIPGIGAMTDTLEFVKNLWGGMKVPGMAMPSLSVDDINKQIADLKAVEAWLNVNMNMLRSTIQALEVQRATLAALQSMSASMAAMVQPGAAARPNGPAQDGKAGAAGATATAPAAAPSFDFAPPSADKPAPPGTGAGASAASAAAAPIPPQPETIGMNSAATFANPAAWWNLLQDQFRQAVTSAVAAEAKPQADAAAPGNAAGNGAGDAAGDAAGNAANAAKPKSRVRPKTATTPAKKRATKS